jgi:hypothetical protein
MTPEERLRRERLTDSCRSLSGGVMGGSIGDGLERRRDATEKRIARLKSLAHAGDRDAPQELARILFADELTR